MAAPTTNQKKNQKKKASSNSSHIPDELSLMILHKLPVKSLKRFSCVCKSWSQLFENHDFFNMFRNNLTFKSHPLYDDACIIVSQYSSRNNWNVYLLSGDKFENKIKLDLPPKFCSPEFAYHPVLLGSAVNGILCIYNDGTNRTDSFLWNPAINEVKVIPPGFARFKRGHTTCIRFHGFGYDHVRRDYKVIRHVDYYTSDCVKLDSSWEIYSLKSNKWRKINFEMPTIGVYDSHVYFDGICHWWGVTNTLVSFNLCNEAYCVTPSPLEHKNTSANIDVKLTLLNGRVAIIATITNKRIATRFQVFILGEFGFKESWIKLFDVQRMSVTKFPIGIGKKGNMFFRTKDDELTCLDLTTGLIKEIGLKGSMRSSQVVIYNRNLHPVIGFYHWRFVSSPRDIIF